MAQDTIFQGKTSINCRGKLVDISSPLIMGILNVTPDSFYDGGKHETEKAILAKTEELITEGATFIDIGAASARPGAEQVPEEDELKRLLPAVEMVAKAFPEIVISIDTYRSGTARKGIEAGAAMVNDISGGQQDSELFTTIAELQVPYVLMHIKGSPKDMQEDPQYDDLMAEVSLYFSERVAELHRVGVNDIILDPGFGFGKTVEHNYELLKNLHHFSIFELPIMAGVSRKSMINRVLGTQPDNALNGTTVANTIALMNGASILRVHDAEEAREAARIVGFLKNS